MRYELSHAVEPDLEQIGDYIARHNQRRALSFVLEIEAHFSVIASNPEGYRLRTDLGPNIRIALFGMYLVVFRVLGETAIINRVLSGYRDLTGLT